MVVKTDIIKLIIWVIFLFNPVLSYAQIIDIGNGETVDCEYASGTLDTALCTLHLVQQVEKKIDSLYKVTYTLLDSLATVQAKEKAELKKKKVISQLQEDARTHRINGMTDFQKIKTSLIQSRAAYSKYVELQSDIIGELVGNGTARSADENGKRLSLFATQIEQLETLLQDLRNYF